MANLAFQSFICRSDNYGVLVHDGKSGLTATLDAPDAGEIERQLRRLNWTLTHVFVTHHHADHVDGIMTLKQQYGCTVFGPAAESDRIPGLDRKVSGGDSFTWADCEVRVMSCPGHTLGHLAYHMPSEQAVFAGDTLFSMGCGRVFEGKMEQMFQSVSQFKALAPSTRLYCGHEYTHSNARFALSVEPKNTALRQRAAEVDRLRTEEQLTCPSSIGVELLTNPFLRTDSREIRENLGLLQADDVAVFSELRRRKDSFR